MTIWFFFFSLLLQWYTWIDFQMMLSHWVGYGSYALQSRSFLDNALSIFSLSLLGSWGIIILLFCHPKIMCSWGKAYKISPSLRLWLTDNFSLISWSNTRTKQFIKLPLNVSFFFFFLSRLALLPGPWSILDNVPCALEKNVYYALGWNAL